MNDPIATARQAAVSMRNYDLDEQIAVAAARRDCAAAHGRRPLAELWQAVLLAFAEHRDNRRSQVRELEQVTPGVTILDDTGHAG